MEDSITSLDVGEESVAQTLTLVSAFHQTSDVHNIEKGRNLTEIHIQSREIYVLLFS